MKRSCSLLLLLFITSRVATAQVPGFVNARIDQVAARFAHPSDFDTLFTPSFLAQVGPSELAPIFQKLASHYGTAVRWQLTDSSKMAAVEGRFILQKDAAVKFSIDVDPRAPHRIQGLLFQGVSLLVPTLDSIVHLIRALPGKAAIDISAVNSVRGASPSVPPTHRDAGIYVQLPPESSATEMRGANADSLFALGSAFKLWVLSALVKRIEGGQVQWSDVVTLDSASLSLPSGELHTWPVGTPLTYASLAALMVSKSDNTATDLLMHAVGRDAIEDAMITTGSTHLNANNRPVPTTLEMFKLKSGDGALAKKYLTLSLHNREEFLKTVVDPMSRDSVMPWSEPLLIDKVEWFATPQEMTKLLLWLKDHTDSTMPGAMARQILAINPGVHVDRHVWKYVGYKGGSEPGVITMNYLIESSNGSWYTLTAAWNNPHVAIDEAKFVGLVERAIELLAEH